MSDPAAPHFSDHARIPGRAAMLWNKVLHNPSAMIVANTATQSALRLVSNIILARLLAPSAFALTAITSLVLTGIQMVSDVGIAITALREGEMSAEDEARLWTMQLVRGIGVALVVAAAAVPVGWIYQDARLRDVLFALALMPALQGAQSLYPVLALIHRRLLPSTLMELGGRIVAMTVSILVALVSPTVWSLVIGTLAAAQLAEILATGTFFEVAESSLRHFPLVEGTPHYEVWTVIVRLVAFRIAVPIVHATDAGVTGYALGYVAGLAASHLFMLVTCVRRGYLRPGFDLALVALLAAAEVVIYVLPLERAGTLELVAQAAMVAVVGGRALLLVYVRRGLPSLPAEPASATLRDAAEDEPGTLLKRA